ncbi:MAG: twin-arginine translocase TatA/TatE family subunit [Alphaproteobacteria bacterium]
MGFNSIWHWLIVLAIVLILFGGGGKLSKMMGDLGKGIKNFKKGVSTDEGQSSDATAAPQQPSISANASSTEQPVRKDDAVKT